MTKIASNGIEVSFEFFPPQTPAMERQLWRAVQRLKELRPRFASITYGADGSTRERTHAAVERIVQETSLTAAPHLTCIGASRGEVDDVARRYWDMGIRHLVALRGDPPAGKTGKQGTRARRSADAPAHQQGRQKRTERSQHFPVVRQLKVQQTALNQHPGQHHQPGQTVSQQHIGPKPAKLSLIHI